MKWSQKSNICLWKVFSFQVSNNPNTQIKYRYSKNVPKYSSKCTLSTASLIHSFILKSILFFWRLQRIKYLSKHIRETTFISTILIQYMELWLLEFPVAWPQHHDSTPYPNTGARGLGGGLLSM